MKTWPAFSTYEPYPEDVGRVSLIYVACCLRHLPSPHVIGGHVIREVIPFQGELLLFIDPISTSG
jgi:hypothetical protein